MNKLFYPLALLLSLVFTAHSQTDLSKVIPPSPTAASLGKYGDIPVSTYTGVPTISIPIYEIKDKGLTVPISLSYHASGIRVEEEASWAGLGWSLMAGGVITRSVRGLDDLLSDGTGTGYPVTPLPTTINENNDYVPPPGNPDYDYFRQVCSGHADAEPDVFYFNFPGHSGKFVFQQNSLYTTPYTVQLASQEKIKVYYDGDQHWTITTDDGVKYSFGTTEKTRTSTIDFDPYHIYTPIFTNPRTVVSSWYLDEIDGPNGEQIQFKYSDPSLNGSTRTISVSDSRQRVGDIQILGSTCSSPITEPISHSYAATQNVTYDVYLKEIDFPNGKIEFQTSTRTDLEPYTDNTTPLSSYPQKLDKIILSKVVQDVATPLKIYELGYDYFNANASDPYTSKRLRLLSLTEKAPDNTTKPPYLFDYTLLDAQSGSELPAKNSWSRDHWGFFNNKPNTNIVDITSTTGAVKSLIPPFNYQNADGSFTYTNGANRDPDANYMKAGLLKKITYPTGGITDFEFEPNDYSTNENVKIPKSAAVYAYGPQVQEPDLTLPASQTFTIVNPHTVVKVSGSIYQSADAYCNGDENYTIIIGAIQNTGTGTTATQVSVKIGCGPTRGYEYYITMEPGTYQVSATTINPDQETYINVNWDEETTQPLYNKIGGGLRIAKTIDYDGINHANDVVKRYVYTKNTDGIERSSGVLMAPLQYSYIGNVDLQYIDIEGGVNVCQTHYLVSYIHLTAESNIPLGNSAQGSPVGYSEVTILYEENGENGKSVYDYVNYPDSYASYPNIPTVANPENGVLINATDYKKKRGTVFQKVKEVVRTYINEEAQATTIKGMKCYGCELVLGAGVGDQTYPMIKFYDVNSTWVHPQSETVKVYDAEDESKFQQTVTQYYYDNPVHKQLTKMTQTQSDGSAIITEYTYPADYTAVNSGAIGAMKNDDHYIHNAVIEKVTKRQRGTDTKVVDANFTVYGSPDGISAIVPVENYSLEIKSPQTGFTSSLATGTPADNAYRLKRTITYGDWTNPTEVQDKDNIKTSYIWGYEGVLPVAQVVGAGVTDIFYSSFEDPAGWGTNTHENSNAITGNHTYSGSMTETMTHSGNYVVTLWSGPSGTVTVNGASGTLLNGNGPNGWKLYQWALTNANTVAISGTEIDEVRILPSGTQMTTYTYEPLVGVTSQCDPNNRVTYFKYDSLFRLTVVKDQDGNIIKTYKYNYKQ